MDERARQIGNIHDRVKGDSALPPRPASNTRRPHPSCPSSLELVPLAYVFLFLLKRRGPQLLETGDPRFDVLETEENPREKVRFDFLEPILSRERNQLFQSTTLVITSNFSTGSSPKGTRSLRRGRARAPATARERRDAP